MIKSLSRQDESDSERIIEKIKELEASPFPRGYKKVKGERDVYRIRVGDFRILYKILRENRVILVFRVDRREVVYRR